MKTSERCKLVFGVIAIALSSNVEAFWRINCANIQYGRIDPIVNPGVVSAHVHAAQGAANFGVNATFDSLRQSECSSCEVQDDKSAYWTPLLYYQYPNGSLINVGQSGSVVYYIQRGVNGANAVPHPPGFRMVSGDAAARAYDPTTLTWDGTRPISDRVSWACLSTIPSRETYNISNTDCYAGLRAQLHFQACWDGVNLYKPDQSHVAYMSDMDNGACPPTHPVQFMHIFLETSYQVNSIPGRVPGGRLVLSTGDTTGYSFHGDFMNGWNYTVFKQAIAECNPPNSSGDVTLCPPLYASYIRNAPQRCPMRTSTINETVTGMLDKLPGCLNIMSGPARAQPSDMNCPPSVPRPAIIPTPDSTPLNIAIPTIGQPFGRPGWTYTGCSNDTQYGKRVLTARSTYASNMTVEMCQDYCTSGGYKYAGLEIGDECYCDNYLQNNAVINTGSFNDGMCYYQCYGNKLEYCGGAARLDIYNNTAIVAPPLPSIMRASGTYGYKGCYIEKASGRLLANGSSADNTMTPNVCRKTCLAKGWKWFGVEYGRECYCGESVPQDAVRAPDSDCSMTCAGNLGVVQAYCGAANRLSMYYSATL